MQEWPEGSLEETVQNAIKTWEMEISHKVRLQDIKSINPEKFKLIVNGMIPTCEKISPKVYDYLWYFHDCSRLVCR